MTEDGPSSPVGDAVAPGDSSSPSGQDVLPPLGDLWACDRCGIRQGILHLLRGHWLCDRCIVEAKDIPRKVVR